MGLPQPIWKAIRSVGHAEGNLQAARIILLANTPRAEQLLDAAEKLLGEAKRQIKRQKKLDSKKKKK